MAISQYTPGTQESPGEIVSACLRFPRRFAPRNDTGGRHSQACPCAPPNGKRPPSLSLRGSAGAVAISGRHCRSVRAIEKRHAPPICHCEERSDVAISGRHCRSERAIVKTVRTSDLSLRGAKRRGNLAVLARITEKLRRIRPPERQSKHETVLCLPFDQQRKYCPVHRHDKRPAKKIVRASGRPRGWLYKAILCQKISLF